MKKIIFSLIIAIFLISGGVNASFPVKNEEVKNEFTSIETKNNIETSDDFVKNESSSKHLKKMNSPRRSSMSDKEFIITLLLFGLFWSLAGHRWYRGKPTGWNILFILTMGGFGIWACVDLFMIFMKKF